MRIVILIITVFVFFAACKDLYDPDVHSKKPALVIDGIMTNHARQLSVRVSETVPYDSTYRLIPVRRASVFVYDDLQNMTALYEEGFGVYKNDFAFCIPGRQYMLKVVTQEGKAYESTFQSLPVNYRQDTVYTEKIDRPVYVPDAYGDFFVTREKGIEAYVDLSSSNNQFPKCRYDVKATVLYSISLGTSTLYCWKSFNPNLKISVSETKFEKSVGKVQKQTLCFLNMDINRYDGREGAIITSMLLTVNKYSLSDAAHHFYTKMNEQLVASGKIFDPVPSQLHGNMKCTNSPENLVVGFFEVSYAEKFYYRCNVYNNPVDIDLKEGFPNFTNEGEAQMPPDFWY